MTSHQNHCGHLPASRESDAITARSFQVIEEELQGESLDPVVFPIVRRVIHATADFDFVHLLRFHLYRLMRQHYPEIRIEVVPGVTSIAAVAGAAGFPLARADERIAILPATFVHAQLPAVLKTFDTVVLMKVHNVLNEVIEVLTTLGLKERACLVEKCSTAEERVIHDLDSVRGQKLHYFSTLLIRTARPEPSRRGE